MGVIRTSNTKFVQDKTDNVVIRFDEEESATTLTMIFLIELITITEESASE